MTNQNAMIWFTKCLLLLALAGCGGGEGENKGENGTRDAIQDESGVVNAGSVKLDHSSPSKLFETVIAATSAGDNAAIIAAFTPATQSEIAGSMIAMVPASAMIPGADKAGMITVLKNHGIAESDLPGLGPGIEDKAKVLAERIEDKPAFVQAMMSKLPNAAQFNTMSYGFVQASMKLDDLQVNGDRANARVTAAGQTSEQDRRIYFVQVDGKWYLDKEDGE